MDKRQREIYTLLDEFGKHQERSEKRQQTNFSKLGSEEKGALMKLIPRALARVDKELDRFTTEVIMEKMPKVGAKFLLDMKTVQEAIQRDHCESKELITFAEAFDACREYAKTAWTERRRKRSRGSTRDGSPQGAEVQLRNATASTSTLGNCGPALWAMNPPPNAMPIVDRRQRPTPQAIIPMSQARPLVALTAPAALVAPHSATTNSHPVAAPPPVSRQNLPISANLAATMEQFPMLQASLPQSRQQTTNEAASVRGGRKSKKDQLAEIMGLKGPLPSQQALQAYFPRIAMSYDYKHFVKNVPKRVKTASQKFPDLLGRGENIQGTYGIWPTSRRTRTALSKVHKTNFAPPPGDHCSPEEGRKLFSADALER